MDTWAISLEEQGRILFDNRSFLLNYLDPDDMIDELIQERIVGQFSMQQLQLMGISRRDKNQIIFDQLNTAGPGTLEKFCKILRKGVRQKFVADQLEKTCCSIKYHGPVGKLALSSSIDFSSLKARYLRHLSTEYTDWPQQYVQLALVKEGVTRTDKDIEEITRLTLQGNVDEVLLRKEPLNSLSDIFHYQNKPCPRILLIVGGPGIGKTTLANQICVKWAGEKFLAEDFDAVILIPLKLVQQRSLEEVMKEHIGEEIYQKLKNSAGTRCLIILEGLDEMATDYWQNDKFFVRLIVHCTIFEKATIVITSRPHVCENIVAGSARIYSFAHLTIQEFLCAVHISTLSPQEQESIISDSYQDYPTIFTFICGLLKLVSTDHKIFQLMHSRLTSGCRNSITAVKCTFESQHNVKLQSTTPFALDMRLKTLLPYDCLCLSYVLSCYPVSQLNMWGCLIGQKGAEVLVKHYPVKALSGYLLQKLNLYGNNLTLDRLVHVMKIIKANSLTLTELDVGGNSIGDDGILLMCEGLRCNNVINELRIEKCGISVKGATYINELLNVTSSLKVLDMSCNSIGDDGISVILKELHHNSILTKLKMENCRLSVKGAVHIGEALSTNRTLQFLEMGRNNIGDDGISVIIRELQLNCSLIKLKVQACGFSSKGITHIDEMLAVNCALQVLVFESNDISDNGISMISRGLDTNKTLTELWIQRCLLSAQGAVSLSKALKVNTVLQVLNLCGNNIGNDGITAISQVLHYTRITELYIRGCGITLHGAKSLATALKINHIITKLQIGDNLITVEGAGMILQSAVDNGVCQEVWINDEYWIDNRVKRLMEILENREKQEINTTAQ